jgi:LETM1 and EF-hand domain-containing protein 1, mitochondrial
VNRGLSGTLLILSKAFAFNRGSGTDGEGDEIMRSLKDTLASLPDNLVRFFVSGLVFRWLFADTHAHSFRSSLASFFLAVASPPSPSLPRPSNQVNETELEVSSDSASYKQRLEVLQQQEELIEDEEEQEMKESEARRLKKESEEEAKRVAAEEEKQAREKEEKEEERKVGEEKDKAEEMLPKEEVRLWLFSLSLSPSLAALLSSTR